MSHPALDAVFGHGATVALIRRDLESGRPHHAYLLIGPPGIGKREIAVAMAGAIACPVAPWVGCGECPSCLRAGRDNHPDVIVVTPDEGFFKIKQVRDARGSMADSPLVSPRKVYLFLGIEAITTEGANALLKVLEEPPPNVVFVMTASGLGSIPGTVLSRCRVIELAALTAVEAAVWLVSNAGLSPDDASFFAVVLDGAPRRYLEWRDAWGEQTLGKRIVPVLAGPGGRAPKDLFDLSSWIDEKAGEGAETGQEKRERVLLLVEVVAGLLAAALAVRAGSLAPHPLAAGIVAGPLGGHLEEAWEEARRARALIDANVNHRMALDRLWLRLQIMTRERRRDSA